MAIDKKNRIKSQETDYPDHHIYGHPIYNKGAGH